MRGTPRTFFIIVLTLLVSSTLGVNQISPVHAAGLLYISPTTLPTVATGSSFTVQVQVANVDPFSGWDVEVRTDESILSPTSVSIDGNLLAANFSATLLTVANCVNGQGTGCTGEDGLGIAHSAAAFIGSSSLPPGPTSGLLFTITYKVLNGGTGVSLIEILRAIVVNGITDSFVDVSTANAVYGSAPDFGAVLSPLFADVTQGNMLTVNAVISSFNGFSGYINLTALSVLSAYVLPSTVFLPSGGSVTAQLFASPNLCDLPSSYTLDLAAASGNVTHRFTAFPNVDPNVSNIPDFCFIRLENPVSVAAGSPGAIDFQLASLNQFNGTVSMTITIIPKIPNGPTVNLASTAVSLYPGGKGHGKIIVSSNTATATGTYTVLVNGTSQGHSHFLTETVQMTPPAPAFTMTASPSSLTLAPGTNTTGTIILGSLFGFNAPIALGTITQPFIAGGPTVSLSLYTLQLSGTVDLTLTVSAPRDATLGSYNETILATGGEESTSVIFTIHVVPLNPPFFTGFQWTHKVSIQHNAGIETFQISIRNPNKTPIFVAIQIDGIGGSGIETFHLATGILQLRSGQTLTGIILTKTFSQSDLGTAFQFSTMILWGTNPGTLAITGSSRPGVPTSGSFIITT